METTALYNSTELATYMTDMLDRVRSSMRATSYTLIKNTEKVKRSALVRDIAIFEGNFNLGQKLNLTQHDREPNIEAESYTSIWGRGNK